MAWHPSDSYLIVGGAGGVIRKIDLDTGLFVLDFKFHNNSELIIWDLVYSNSFIVSADSNGNVIIWNDIFGTVFKVFNTHSADVLTLALSKHHDIIYSSGVDQKIVCYKKLSENNWWVKDSEFRIHFNDVYALDMSLDGLLASGGIDSYLAITDTTKFRTRHIKQYGQSQNSAYFFSYAPNAKILMHQTNTSLQLWRTVDKKPVNFLTIHLKSMNYILSSSLSADGTKVAISTVRNFWLYCIDTLKLKVRRLLFLKMPSYKQIFCCNNRQLVMASINGGLKTLDFQSKQWTNFKDTHLQITDFISNKNGSLLIARTNNYELLILDLKEKSTLYKIRNFGCFPLYIFPAPISHLQYRLRLQAQMPANRNIICLQNFE